MAVGVLVLALALKLKKRGASEGLFNEEAEDWSNLRDFLQVNQRVEGR